MQRRRERCPCSGGGAVIGFYSACGSPRARSHGSPARRLTPATCGGAALFLTLLPWTNIPTKINSKGRSHTGPLAQLAVPGRAPGESTNRQPESRRAAAASIGEAIATSQYRVRHTWGHGSRHTCGTRVLSLSVCHSRVAVTETPNGPRRTQRRSCQSSPVFASRSSVACPHTFLYGTSAHFIPPRPDT